MHTHALTKSMCPHTSPQVFKKRTRALFPPTMTHSTHLKGFQFLNNHPYFSYASLRSISLVNTLQVDKNTLLISWLPTTNPIHNHSLQCPQLKLCLCMYVSFEWAYSKRTRWTTSTTINDHLDANNNHIRNGVNNWPPSPPPTRSLTTIASNRKRATPS